MPESFASTAPFVCKWFGAHQRFNTQEELERHVYNDHKDLAKLKAFYRECLIYKCPWEGCEKQLSDIPKLKEHLCEHTRQRPFKCPICNGSRQFESLDKLNQHLIFNHNDSIVDSTGAVDMTKQEKGDTSEDENYINTSKGREICVQKLIVKKHNQGNTAKYEVENEDYLICKAFAKHYDRKSFEKLLVQNGLTDIIDLDEFF